MREVVRDKVLKTCDFIIDFFNALFDRSRIIIPVIAVRIDIGLQRTGNIL